MDIGDKKVLLISFAKTFFTAQEELSFGLKAFTMAGTVG